jgi:tRNA(adenine34) deaminase
MHAEDLWLPPFDEAWLAFQEGSVPVGATFLDRAGRILWRGRNRIYINTPAPPLLGHTRLAHAEINCLVQAAPETFSEMASGVLVTTLEPCPLCVGAAVMAGVRRMRYAASDPWAGATHLLRQDPYMASKSVWVEGPEPVWQTLSLVLATVSTLRRASAGAARVVEAFRTADAKAVRLGEVWSRSGYLDAQARAGAPLTSVIAAMEETLGRMPDVRPQGAS